MRTVMKFGGSVLSSCKDLQRVAGIVGKRRQGGEELCIVVSALKGITDGLIEASEKALESERSIEEFVRMLRKKHFALLDGLKSARTQKLASKRLGEKICVLERALYGINYLGELSEKSKALIYSFGERLSAVLVEAFLSDFGVKAKAFDADEVGIVTDSCFAAANPLMEIVRLRVRETIEPLLEEFVVVVTGYFGCDKQGNVTCFGRGGSDFSAGVLANALNATQLELWKDVDGFLSADPKTVKRARLLKSLSYAEAEELGYFGAKILHPRTIAPLREKGIKAVVKNVLKPEKVGTVISSEKTRQDAVIKGIASRENIAMVHVQSAAIVGLPGALSQIFSALAERGISIDLVSTSETSVSFTISEEKLGEAKRALNECPLKFDSMRFESGVAMVGVIGEGMKGKPSAAGKVFDCLGKQGIDVEMVSQGSSEINLSLVVKLECLERAVKAIHKALLEEL